MCPVPDYLCVATDLKLMIVNSKIKSFMGPNVPMGLCGDLPFSIYTDIYVAYKYYIAVYFNATFKRK